MTDLLIRPYESADCATLLRIAADTAFFGDPIEAVMDERQAFLDSFYAYYPDMEPGHAWVACADGIVVGFLVGCIDTREKERAGWRRIYPRVAADILRGRYRIGRRSLGYALAALVSALRGDIVKADLDRFPAHLHINLQAGWRGFGLGRKLMEAYLGQLRGLGVPGVHLGTTSMNEAACALYEKMGFTLVGARRLWMWQRLIHRDVDERCYALSL